MTQHVPPVPWWHLQVRNSLGKISYEKCPIDQLGWAWKVDECREENFYTRNTVSFLVSFCFWCKLWCGCVQHCIIFPWALFGTNTYVLFLGVIVWEDLLGSWLFFTSRISSIHTLNSAYSLFFSYKLIRIIEMKMVIIIVFQKGKIQNLCLIRFCLYHSCMLLRVIFLLKLFNYVIYECINTAFEGNVPAWHFQSCIFRNIFLEWKKNYIFFSF